MKYDVIIVGAGPGGIFTAYELQEKNTKIWQFGQWELLSKEQTLGRRLSARRIFVKSAKK